MADDDSGIFTQVQRIEKEADEIIGKAKADADKITKEAEREAAETAREADRTIEQTRTTLAGQYQAKTEQTLTQIDVEFLKEEERLETIREGRLEGLVEWAAARIAERQIGPRPDGD